MNSTTLSRAGLLAVLACLLALTTAASASADVRTATATDGADPTVGFDVAEAKIAIDRGTGSLTLNVALHHPAPTLSPSVPSLTVWALDSAADSCVGGAEKVGDTYVSIRPDATGALTATANVKFRSDFPTVPLTLSADRRALSVTFSDELLKQGNPRCLAVSATGQGTADPSQPGGGPMMDDVTPVWFDGQAPPAVAPTVPAAGAGCADPLMRLSGAEQVARGTTGFIHVRFVDDFEHTYSGGAKLVMADLKSGKPFYTKNFGAGKKIFGEEDLATFFISLDPERKPALVTLTWAQKDEFGDAATCTLTQRVAPIRGSAPRFYVRGGGSGALIPRGSQCWLTRAERVTVTVTGGGRRARFTRKDACTVFSGRSRTLGSIRVSRADDGIVFTSRGRGRARLTVKVGKRTVLRRTVVSRQRSTPDRRIWEGTDAFFNYCLKGDHELTSSGGRLYCVKPGSYSEAVLFR